MHMFAPVLALLAGLAAAAPVPVPAPKIPFVTPKPVIQLSKGQNVESRAAACFIVGNKTLPQEINDAVSKLAVSVTCNPHVKTVQGVPDVTSGKVKFSDIDFSKSPDSPLQFALKTFATAPVLAQSDLQTFQDRLNVYQSTEAGVRSIGGAFGAIKIPKFFIEMQVSRIQTAQGKPPTAAGLQVDHLRDKVLKNAATENKALLDQVTALAAQK